MLRRTLRILGALGLLGATTFVVWPTTLGGAATFVVVRGNSMEPTYHQGDLLYARNDRDFAPGDAAIYRIPKGKLGAGALVVHRIKERLPDGTYLFQGDNKKAVDDVTPSREDVIATPMFNLGGWPTKGLILAPIVCTVIVGIAVTCALWPAKRVRETNEDEDRPDAEDDDDDSAPRRRGFLVRSGGTMATLTPNESFDRERVGP